MEQTVKKRGWVKNAAIIFLAVMLVLTFFSNTILNRSLPEASAVLCMPGTIDSKVRISGTVSARENYDVILDQTRKVLSVAVKQGQEVSTGDLLFTLEPGDSTELDQAREELHQAQLSYQRALINAAGSDYSRENRTIEQAREAVVKAQEKADLLADTEALEQELQAGVDEARTKEDEAGAKLAAAEQAVAERESAVKTAKSALDDVEAILKGSQKELKTAQYGFNHSSDGTSYTPTPLSGLQDQLSAATAARVSADNDLQAAISKYGNPVDGNGFKDFEDTALQNISADTGIALPGDYSAYLPFYPGPAVNDTRYISAVDASYELPAGIVQRLPYYLDSLSKEYSARDAGSPERAQQEAYAAIRAATDAFQAAVVAENAARSALDDAGSTGGNYESPVSYDGKSHGYWEKEVARLELVVEDVQERVNDAREAADAAELALNEAKTEQTTAKATVDAAAQETENALEHQKQQREARKSEQAAAQAEVVSAQNTLADLLFSLEEQKKDDNKAAQLAALDLQEQLNQIAKLQARVDELSGASDEQGAAEVRSKVNGTVKSLSVSAGHQAKAGETVVEIEVSDLGYTLTASVSGDQARLLHVGDVATVNNYYWGNPTTAEIIQIRPDAKNPQDGKQITFAVSGNVEAGTTLSFAIGEKNASYDYVVPNAAVRSDTNGQFLLVITAKNSPLGNRYFATRVNVEVVASDDLNSAVKGPLEGHESVILTTSNNAPLKNGDQVRLPDVN